MHWEIIHARLLLAWLPEHVSRKKLTCFLIDNVKNMSNFTSAIQTWKAQEAFSRLLEDADEIKESDLEGLVGTMLLEYPQATQDMVGFVREGWKKLSKDELLNERKVMHEFARTLCGINKGG